MNIRQLQYFIAVAEERHMGRAAAKLHLSQPPLTRHIQALEAQLGVALFERTPRGMALTQAGEALYQDARSVNLLLGQAVERTQRTALGERGTLDIGVFGSSLLKIVPELLSRFTQQHPDVKLVFHHAPAHAQLEALRQRRVLLAFERVDEDFPGLTRVLIAREKIFVASHVHHRIATLKTVKVSDLGAELMVLPAGLNSHTGRTVLALMAKHGIAPQLAVGAGDVLSTLSLMGSGSFAANAVALVPASSTVMQIPHLAYRPLEGKAFMALHAIHRTDDASPLLASLLKCLGAEPARENLVS